MRDLTGDAVFLIDIIIILVESGAQGVAVLRRRLRGGRAAGIAAGRTAWDSAGRTAVHLAAAALFERGAAYSRGRICRDEIHRALTGDGRAGSVVADLAHIAARGDHDGGGGVHRDEIDPAAVFDHKLGAFRVGTQQDAADRAAAQRHGSLCIAEDHNAALNRAVRQIEAACAALGNIEVALDDRAAQRNAAAEDNGAALHAVGIGAGGRIDLPGDVAEHLDRLRAGQRLGRTVRSVGEALNDAKRTGGLHIIARPIGDLAAVAEHDKAARTLLLQHTHQQLCRLLTGDGLLRSGRTVRHTAEPSGPCGSSQIAAVPVAALHVREGLRSLADKTECAVDHADKLRAVDRCIGVEPAVGIATDQVLVEKCFDLRPAPVTAEVSGKRCVCRGAKHQHNQKKSEQSFADCVLHSLCVPFCILFFSLAGARKYKRSMTPLLRQSSTAARANGYSDGSDAVQLKKRLDAFFLLSNPNDRQKKRTDEFKATNP